MRLIETGALENWAGSIAARSRFPYWLNTLICAVIRPKSLRIPAAEAVGLPGWDGVVINEDQNQNRFVPFGVSVWEMGTGKDFEGKANEDYNPRTNGELQPSVPSGVGPPDRANITFVFATPRPWADKAQWETDRRAEGHWKDVIVVDGITIADWLETAPAVTLRFASELSLVPPVGLFVPELAWEDWRRRSEPPTTQELLTVGRDEQARELLARLADSPSTITVRCDSRSEAWAFSLAVIRRAPTDQGLNLEARTIVAGDDQLLMDWTTCVTWSWF